MKEITSKVLKASAAVTATDTGTGVDVSDFQGQCKVLLNASAMGGTTPTSNVKLQHSDTLNGTYTDIPYATFAAQAAAASEQEIDLTADSFKKFVRSVNTITGTTPTQTYGVTLVGIKQ